VFFNSVNVKEADLLRVSLFFYSGIYPILQDRDFIFRLVAGLAARQGAIPATGQSPFTPLFPRGQG
jgi:hypothetical protein